MKAFFTIKYILFFFLSFHSLHAQQAINRFELLEAEVDRSSYLQKQKSSGMIEEMYHIAHENSSINSSLLARTYYMESILNFRQGINDSVLIEKINLRLQEKIVLHEEALLKAALSFCISATEDYIDAFNLSLQVIENAKSLNDSLLIARTFNHMGNICKKISLNSMAENYYLEALKWTQQSYSNNIYPAILINLYSLHLYLHEDTDKDEVVREMEKMINILSELNQTGLLSILYINISGHISGTEDYKKSLFYLEKAGELYEDNPYGEAFVFHNLGMYYLYVEKNYEKALSYLQDAEAYWKNNNNYSLLAILYKDISNLYEELNMPSKALQFERESTEYMNIVTSNSKIIEIYQKYILTLLDASEDKLALAESEIRLKNKQFTIILISSISIIVISILLVIFLLQKRKSMRQLVLLKEAEAKELEIRLQQEQVIQKEKEESKLRELTTYSLLLTNKNEVLNKILEVAETISSNTEMDNRKKIETIIHENIRAENDWNDFVIHFEKVHPRFFEKVREYYPDISQSELRLMAYIRIGISTKQISQMLNVTPESIRTSRYRLKKKLTMEKEANLDDFIHSI